MNAEKARQLVKEFYLKQESLNLILDDILESIAHAATTGCISIAYSTNKFTHDKFMKVKPELESLGFTVESCDWYVHTISWQL